jgi:hypothetical protein
MLPAGKDAPSAGDVMVSVGATIVVVVVVVLVVVVVVVVVVVCFEQPANISKAEINVTVITR